MQQTEERKAYVIDEICNMVTSEYQPTRGTRKGTVEFQYSRHLFLNWLWVEIAFESDPKTAKRKNGEFKA